MSQALAFCRWSLFAALAVPVVHPMDANDARPKTTPTGAPGFAALEQEVLPALERARDLGPADPAQVLGLCISLPYARPEALHHFVDSVSNPNSPSYRHFISPEEVGVRFGVGSDQVNAVADYLTANGFTLTLVSRNRTSILANATVAQAEAAFHTTIRTYALAPRDAVEPSRFVAYSTRIALPSHLAPLVLDVSGLETYTRPQPRTTLLTPALTRGLYDSVGLFNNGVTGSGRAVGISNWDGFRAADYVSYVNHFALPVPAGGAGSNVVVIPCGGGGAGAGPASAEGDLDIQMELGMAPLATVLVYDGTQNGNLLGVLAQEASDNLADVISESWGWALNGSAASAAHNSHLAMSAQGITYMAASGDSGTGIEPYSYPDIEPEVLVVGGTVANVNNSNGSRISEVGWNGSGGGWSTHTNVFNVRPPWQVGTGVPPINGTNDHRLIPDVGFHAAGSGTGAYQFYTGGGLQGGYVGTSFASPMFAGSLGVIEQYVIAHGGLPPDASGKQRFGRIQDLIYGMNGRSDVWHDITTGNNGTLPDGTPSSCHAGWDTVTGWGPLDCQAFGDVATCLTGGCGPGSVYCAGDSLDANVTTLCPCFNFGAPGHGCANSFDANGAVLSAAGTNSPDTVVFTSTGLLPTSLAIFMQGTTNVGSGLLFGDGIRCVSGVMKRLYTKNAVGGVVSAPGAGDPSITARSASLGDPIASGSTRYYQVYYHDLDPNFCPSLTFNVSSGYRITWP